MGLDSISVLVKVSAWFGYKQKVKKTLDQHETLCERAEQLWRHHQRAKSHFLVSSPWISAAAIKHSMWPSVYHVMTGSGFTACMQPRRLPFLTPELNSSASQQKHSADVGSKTGTSNWAKTGATIWQTDHLMTCSLFHTFVHVSDHILNWRTICQQWKYEYNTVKKTSLIRTPTHVKRI